MRLRNMQNSRRRPEARSSATHAIHCSSASRSRTCRSIGRSFLSGTYADTNPRALDEFGEDRVGHFEAAICQLDSAIVERQQSVVEQRSGDAAEDAFEVAAEAIVKVRKRESVSQ